MSKTDLRNSAIGSPPETPPHHSTNALHAKLPTAEFMLMSKIRHKLHWLKEPLLWLTGMNMVGELPYDIIAATFEAVNAVRTDIDDLAAFSFPLSSSASHNECGMTELELLVQYTKKLSESAATRVEVALVGTHLTSAPKGIHKRIYRLMFPEEWEMYWGRAWDWWKETQRRRNRRSSLRRGVRRCCRRH